MTSKLFITGASGFVGGAIARALAGRYELHALSRSEASDAAIRRLGATPVRGELGAIVPDTIAGSVAVFSARRT
jgi:nucleoside-diphosphate-sugar epimerase